MSVPEPTLNEPEEPASPADRNSHTQVLKSGLWSRGMVVFALCCAAFLAVAVGLFSGIIDRTRITALFSGEPDDASLAMAAQVREAVGGLRSPKIVLVDIGRILTAWASTRAGTGSTDDPRGAAATMTFAAEIRKVLQAYSDAGVLVVEPRYALTFPASADQTEAVAKMLGVSMEVLVTQPVTPYVTPPSDPGTTTTVAQPVSNSSVTPVPKTSANSAPTSGAQKGERRDLD